MVEVERDDDGDKSANCTFDNLIIVTRVILRRFADSVKGYPISHVLSGYHCRSILEISATVRIFA